MAVVRLEHIRKSFGTTSVIRDVSLTIADGEFVVFVGPSGCGKSTLLRLIAGLDPVTDGEIWIDDTCVTTLAPSKRGVSMVFQSYALYPHMTAYQNIAFGLKLSGTARETVDERVRRVATMLRIESLLDRKPRQLSGGQRQRVAIARAIVRDPQVFLFDEPLSNLDAALRAQTRVEIATMHDTLAATMIYVTHDQVEAMTLADRIVVLNHGKIEQTGMPTELYHHPANLFVAEFLGSPRMNTFPVTLQDRIARLASGDEVRLPSSPIHDVRSSVVPSSALASDAHSMIDSASNLTPTSLLSAVPSSIAGHQARSATLGIRAEDLHLVPGHDGDHPARRDEPTAHDHPATLDRQSADHEPPSDNTLLATVSLVEELGETRLVHVTLRDGTPVVLRDRSEPPPRKSDHVTILVDTARCHLFDESGARML